MVVFRHDLLHLLQQRQILVQSSPMRTDIMDEEENRLRQPNCRLVKTVLDQGHLVPVAGVPIYWNYDHALRLYPLPDALVLGGDDSQSFHEIYGECDVIHPGSMATQSSYAVYQSNHPEFKGDEDDDSEDDSMGGNNRVEFYQVGDEVTK